MKYFCVSDIHSYYDELMSALIEKGFKLNNKKHLLIVCGDAFDRGPKSKDVFDLLLKLHSENRLIYIRGNHEDLLLKCVSEIQQGNLPNIAHFSNKTVNTICDLTGLKLDVMFNLNDEEVISEIINKIKPMTQFIRDVSRDFFTLGDKIFVHSWLPIKDNAIYDSWDNITDSPIYKKLWEEARWVNPFEMCEKELYPKNKTLVFGHWHTSYYWVKKYPRSFTEFPKFSDSTYIRNCFFPVIENNIIGLDACTAFSGFVNCIVFDNSGNIIR